MPKGKEIEARTEELLLPIAEENDVEIYDEGRRGMVPARLH